MSETQKGNKMVLPRQRDEGIRWAKNILKKKKSIYNNILKLIYEI